MAYDQDKEARVPPRAMEAQAGRETSASILRRRARDYHDYAAQLDKLADFAQHMPNEQDEALWRILCNFTPR